MWKVLKLKLIVPVALITLLTFVFLMVQACLLESSCFENEMASAHRRALFRMTLNSEHQGAGHEQRLAAHVSKSYYLGSLLTSLPVEPMAISNGTTLGQSQVKTDVSSSSSSGRLGQKTSAPSTVESISPHHHVVSKSGHAMQMFFQQLSRNHCQQSNCMENLSDFDKECYDYCTQKGRNRHSGGVRSTIGECKFMRGEGRAAVALASLPGSGNTWVRGLMEKATGICTGESHSYCPHCSIENES